MPPVFTRRSELGVKLAVLGLVAALGTTVAVWASRIDAYDAIGQPVTQPIPFSHKHHVGDVGLDCRYCHATVETAAFAGMPSTAVCLGCHSQLFADAPALAPLRDSRTDGRPIAWNRLYKLPDFVYFEHRVHVAKGVGCVECHGRVDQMPLAWRAQPMQMQWCLDCHRDPRPHLRPPDRVTQMQPVDAPLRHAAAARAVLESERRLTDCSTCHR